MANGYRSLLHKCIEATKRTPRLEFLPKHPTLLQAGPSGQEKRPSEPRLHPQSAMWCNAPRLAEDFGSSPGGCSTTSW